MSACNKGNQPAFPSEGHVNGNAGMSNHFLATCMCVQGILANAYFNTKWSPETIVRNARKIADEIIRQENEI